MTNTSYQGSCLCKKIKYKLCNINEVLGHCHCSMCRKFHGSAFATFAKVDARDFKWVEGEDNLSMFEAPNGTIRKFCQTCGSSLIFQPSKEAIDIIEFAVGTLDDDIPAHAKDHIYTSSKPNWSVISDELPCYAEGRGSPLNMKKGHL